ncbi:glycosyltransferase [Methylolobus aquaticus]|nr:glycosyltransferase [Methylolobus aquaticus]
MSLGVKLLARILHITECFGAGSFRSITLLCNRLSDLGHDVSIGYSRRAETPEHAQQFLRNAVKLYPLPLQREISVTDIRSLLSLVRFIKDQGPDIVHLHSSKAGFLGRLAALIARQQSRVFYSPRGLAFLNPEMAFISRHIYHALEFVGARFGGTIVACSQSEYVAAKRLLQPSALALVENAVDVSQVPRRPGSQTDGIEIVTSGRLSLQKKPWVFARVARELSPRFPRATFTWIGDGDVGREVLLDAGVAVTGWLSPDDALQKVARADIYLQTSGMEGMPIALIEAQVAGVPAVVTDVVGNRDVVSDGTTGYIAKNEGIMLEKVANLCASSELRDELGSRARELGLVRFSPDRLISDYERLYFQGDARTPSVVNAGCV